MFLAEILLDRVTHGFRFGDRLGLVLDPKPRLAVRRIANVPHASSQMAFGTHQHREGGMRCRATGKSGVRSESTATSGPPSWIAGKRTIRDAQALRARPDRPPPAGRTGSTGAAA